MEFRQVIVEFFFYKRKLADCYNTTTRFQLYDELYEIISAKIDKFKLPKPVSVSWLNDKRKEEMEKELKNKQLPDISSIKDRFENIHTAYPKVNFNYFNILKHPNTIELIQKVNLCIKPSSTTSYKLEKLICNCSESCAQN